ncbi:hypothetical protein [Methylocystis sp. S23]
MNSAKRIEVFKPGVFTPLVGEPIAFSAADLALLAQEYDHVSAPAPIVVGHPKTDSPAYGWAKSFVWDEGAQRLFAEPEKLAPAFEDAVRAGAYKKISLSLFRPDAPNNPRPGKWYPKHIGFLGGAAPAVPGLAPVELATDDESCVSIEFGDGAFMDVASLFRGLRDWIIEKNGREEAERVLPNWTIEWIEQAARRDDDGPGLSYAEPQESQMSKEQDAAFAEREAALKAREDNLAKQEAAIADQARKTRHEGHVAFAEKLADEGRLLPVFVQKVAGALDALADQPAEASFAEGDKIEKKAALDIVKEVLAGAPKIVEFGEKKLAADRSSPGAAEFSAPAGMDVDREGLELQAKAIAYQKQNPSVSFVDAVKAVGGK